MRAIERRIEKLECRTPAGEYYFGPLRVTLNFYDGLLAEMARRNGEPIDPIDASQLATEPFEFKTVASLIREKYERDRAK